MTLTLAAGTALSAEDDLLSLVGRGDNLAFAKLYDLTVNQVFGLVRHIVVDHAQSEEVTQEVFLLLWQTASHFDATRGRAVGFILTMARRRAIDRVRSAQASSVRDVVVGARYVEEPRDTVSEAGDIAVEFGRTRRAIELISGLQREAIELVYLDGYSNIEASGRLGVSISTFKTRLRDGLIALRREVDSAA